MLFKDFKFDIYILINSFVIYNFQMCIRDRGDSWKKSEANEIDQE